VGRHQPAPKPVRRPRELAVLSKVIIEACQEWDVRRRKDAICKTSGFIPGFSRIVRLHKIMADHVQIIEVILKNFRHL
jgi:hypothetical protein